MATTTYVLAPQKPTQYPDQVRLPPPVPSVHLEFENSRHRMDKKRSLSIETAQRAIIAGINLFSHYKGDLTEDFILNPQCPEAMNTLIHIGNDSTFKYRGKLLKFLWNKNKCRPADAEEMKQSRVLLIEGLDDVISMESVESFCVKSWCSSSLTER